MAQIDRTLATTLGALAFLWAGAATVYLLSAASPTGIADPAVLAAGATGAPRMPPSLATAAGVWVAGLLMGVTLLAGIPAGVAWWYPSDRRVTAWTAGALLLAFCVLSGISVGLPYLPSAILLILAGAVEGVALPAPRR